MADKLLVDNLNVSIENEKVLNDVSFSLEKGEKVVLMGPNGAGKSTIAKSLMGDIKYSVDSGTIKLNEEDLVPYSIDERARKGILVTFQNPVEIPGVTLANFLRSSYNKIKGESLDPSSFQQLLEDKMKEIGMSSSLRTRYVNSGFSGGEKKRSEILQMLLLEPEFTVLDEIDSGLDVDGVKSVIEALERVVSEMSMGLLMITHNMELVESIGADKVLVLRNGKIEQQGGMELARKVAEKGFE